MKKITLLFLLISSFTLKAQQGNKLKIDIPKGVAPWTSLNLNNSEENFQFAIVTDRTGGHRPGVFMEGIHRLNLLQPEFVMSVGDLIEGYTEDLTELNRQWDEFDGFVNQLKMPFFYLPGNHDITNQVMEDLWEKRLGPTHYYFIYKNVLFLCLNTEDQRRGSSRGSISDEQYEWTKKVLEAHPEVKWTLVFMHQPLWVQETDPVRWGEVESLLKTREHTVFVGHRHYYSKYERNNGKYFLLATTGGGSRLRGPQMGEFDHVVWVTMTEEGPVIANLQLEGIFDENVTKAEDRILFAKLWSQQHLQAQPITWKAGKKFKSGSSRIKITNDQDAPLKVSLQKGFSWDIKGSLSNDKMEVAPNSVEYFDIFIEPRKDQPLDSYDPIKVTANLTYLFTDLPKLNFQQHINIAPQQEYTLSSSKKKITIDGQLEDWKTLPHTISSKDPNDISARFNLSYQGDHLYLGVAITDDDIEVDSNLRKTQNDFIGFTLNAESQEQSALDRGTNKYENSLRYFINPSAFPEIDILAEQEGLPPGSNWKCIIQPNGYNLELAIPIKYIKEQQGEDWKSVRLNIILQDKDAEEKQMSRFYFKPEWHRGKNLVGSGMFFR